MPPPPPPPPPAPRPRPRAGIAPLFLRIALAITFVWAGLGKVLSSFEVRGEAALVLYNLGVIDAPASRAAPSIPVQPDPASTPESPSESPADPPADSPADGSSPDGDGSGPLSRADQARTILAAFQPAPRPPKLASDFTDPVEVLRLHRLTLMFAAASAPTVSSDGRTLQPLLPSSVGAAPWPIVLAYTITITELIGGVFILIGLFARVWAFLLAVAVGLSMWLTQIGPAVRDGNTLLGFLPPNSAFDDAAWAPLLWLLVLLCVCLSLLCSGAGMLSVDRALFTRRRHDEDDD